MRPGLRDTLPRWAANVSGGSGIRWTDVYVGERLRAIRRQKGLSLHDVEARSDQEFKASVLGAYERGERAISVPRLLRLAELYEVPADQLLPARRTTSRSTSPSGTDLERRLHDRPRPAARARRPRRRGARAVRGDDPAAAPGLQRPVAHDPPRRPPGARRGARSAPRRPRRPARRARPPRARPLQLSVTPTSRTAPRLGATLRAT